MSSLSLASRRERAQLLQGPREARRSPIRGAEIRDAGGDFTLTGYASVFDTEYEMGWYTEVVRPGAFTRTLSQGADVQLLINHIGLPLARTTSGTMTLREDSKGLRVEAQLNANDRDVSDLASKMQRGDIDEMSFGFYTKRQAWNDDYTYRELLEVSLHRGDVSVVNYGANPATSATLRYADMLVGLASIDRDAALAELGRYERDRGELLREARSAIDALIAKAGEDDQPALLDLYRARARAAALQRKREA